ncbi:MAG: methyltransferase domain-containing protein [Pseudomonadota bacterium]
MNTDWNVSAYETFADLRLRPALDLLARVLSLPEGPIIDLGCGSGAAGPVLRNRFPDAMLIGIDSSPQMLESAAAVGSYDHLQNTDIAIWRPELAPALIFSNAALHWLADHERLVPRLCEDLTPGGVLAVQMPGQLNRPSHQTMIAAAASLRPDLYTGWTPFPGPKSAADYARLLPDTVLDMWETEYSQRLEANAEGAHPVRAFVSSTGARPILSQLDADERAVFCARWDAALAEVYPLEADGGCWFPFRRIFFVAQRPC